jgi:hypothetical protein
LATTSATRSIPGRISPPNDRTPSIDACRAGLTDVLMEQYCHRYEPSRRLLEAALSPPVD